MSYLGTYHIDDYLPIPAATHRFSSGAAYAPTALTYSIYEEANTTGLDEDVDMVVASPFDGITGCYLVRRQLTTAAGFEAGKAYVVVVKATVDGVAAIQMHTFQIETASVAQTGDAYAIVNHADYGNAKLVRSTTPANTLTVDANHKVAVPDDQKVDLNTIKTQTVTAAAGVTFPASIGTGTSTHSASDVKTALEADGSKIDHLWEMTEDDGGVRRLTANALEEGPTTAAAPSVDDIATRLLVTPANKLDTDATGYIKVSGAKNTLDVLADFDPAADTVNANVTQISGDSTAADRLEAVLDATPGGAVVDDNDPDPTATAFETDLTEATNDHYNGAFVVFTSGALLGQSRKISDYDGTSKVLTVETAFTEAPAAGDAFLIIGRSE